MKLLFICCCIVIATRICIREYYLNCCVCCMNVFILHVSEHFFGLSDGGGGVGGQECL